MQNITFKKITPITRGYIIPKFQHHCILYISPVIPYRTTPKNETNHTQKNTWTTVTTVTHLRFLLLLLKEKKQ